MRFQGLDLNLLVALDALIEHRSVSAAARALHVTQPAMSGVLARLRDYFDDEILVQQRRTMILTPKAQDLAAAVRDVLIQVQRTITQPPLFDPAQSTRCFSVIVSDYVETVLFNDLLRKAAHTAPQVTFRLLPYSRSSVAAFERGDVDLMIVVDPTLVPGHPSRLLFTDQPVAICWEGNTVLGEQCSLAQFQALGHVTTSLHEANAGSLFDVMLREQRIERRVEVEVPAFSLMPGALVGTQRLAVIHRRFAHTFAQSLPLRVLELPFALPPIRELAQWHSARQRDPGLHWLLEEVTSLGQGLAQEP